MAMRTTGESVVMQAYINEHTTRMHYEIEAMTRRLELEKRRLQRVMKEAAAVRKTLEAKQLHTGLAGHLPRSARAASAGMRRPPQPSASSAPRHSIVASSLPAAGVETASTAGSMIASGTRPVSPMAAPESWPLRALQERYIAETKRLDENNLENRQLRAQVDEHRQELMQLTGLFEKLKGDVKRRTVQFVRTAEEAKVNKNVLREATQKLSLMKAQQERERSEFKTELKGLREQLKNNEWKRKEVEVALRRGDHMGIPIQTKRELLVPEQEHGFSEFEMSQRVLKTAFLNCIQRRHMKQHQKNIEVFDQAFATIKQSTGIERIEDIVKVFVTLENRNYSLMTYVNHMNKEIDALEAAQTEDNRLRIEDQKERLQKAETRHRVAMEIGKERESVEQSISSCKAKCQHYAELFKSLEQPIMAIIKRIEKESEELHRATSLGGGGSSALSTLPSLPGDFREETIPDFLGWVEQALRRWRDCFQDPAHPAHAFPSTAKQQVMMLPPKRFGASGQHSAPPLVKPHDLPSAVVALETGDAAQRRPTMMSLSGHRSEVIDDESEEEDFAERPLMLKDLRSRAEQTALKRRRKHPQHRVREATHGPRLDIPKSIMSPTQEHDSTSAAVRRRPGESWIGKTPSIAGTSEDGETKALPHPEHGSDVPSDARRSRRKAGSQDPVPEEDDAEEESEERQGQVTETELSDVFAKSYGALSREELQVVADRVGISLRQLCQIKQEFDHYDEDQSGRIDIHELRHLMIRLLDDPTEEEIEQAFQELDMDNSGEIEFFEFVEWFTTADMA